MSNRVQNGTCAWLAGVLSGILPLLCLGADTQKPPIAIQAQSLDAALQLFALQTGLQLVYLTDLTRGRGSRGCTAAQTPSDALTQLLAGTGLTFGFLNQHTVQIRAATRASLRNMKYTDEEAITAKKRPASAGTVFAGTENPESVIVTARKRPESLMNVPMAITVFTGDSLDLRGTNPLSDVLQDVASRSVVDDGVGTAVLHARGVVTTRASSDTGYYLDELPFTGITVPVAPDIRNWDVERVEVLRGPQGTLFGEGSMNGSVRIMTRNPTFNDWDAKATVQASGTRNGGFNQAYKGLVNIPLVDDRLALRLAGTKEAISGSLDDLVTGQTNVDSQSIVTYRAKLLFRPTDRLTLSSSWWHYDGRFPRGDLTTEELTAPQFAKVAVEMKYALVGVTAAYDFGPFAAFYSLAHNSLSYPQSGPVFGANTLFNGLNLGVTSNELRFSTGNRVAWEWTAGFYDCMANRHDLLSIQYYSIDNTSTTHARSTALFGEVTRHLPNFPVDLGAGARIVRETLDGYDTNAGQPTARLGKTYPSVNPRFSVSWHPSPGVLIYSSAAKGYRSGQLQSSVSLAVAELSGIHLPSILQDDSIWTYEIGTRASLDERISLEADMYHSNWDHPTLHVRLPVPGSLGLINSGGSRTNGAEVDLNLTITRAWFITVGGGYTHTRYLPSAPGTGIVSADLAESDSRITANAALEWQQPAFAGLTGVGRLGVQYGSRRPFLSVENAASLPADAITTVVARLGVQGKRWTAFLFADNLFNDRGAVSPRIVAPADGGFEVDAPRLRPQTVGLELTASLQ